MKKQSVLFPEPSPTTDTISVHGSLDTPLGKIVTVQDAINLLLQAPDKSAPLSINSTSFFSKLSLAPSDNSINAVSYGYPKTTTPRQYYRTDTGGSFDAVQLESIINGHSR